MIAMFLLTGCASKRKLTQSLESKVIQNTEVAEIQESHKISAVESALKKITEIQTSEDVDFSITIYDTDKPADPETGRPPAVADIKGKKKTTTQKQEREESQKNEYMAEKDSSSTHVTTDSQEETKIIESSKTTRKPLWWLYVIVVVAIVVSVWFVYNRIKRGFIF